MDVSDAIKTKRAIRKFKDTPLLEKEIIAIVNAGRRSQSSKNTQPWHFIVITDRTTLIELSKLGEWAGHLATAALGIAIITPNPDIRFSIMFDAGQSAAYMQLAAWELVIGSCLATIYETEKARSLLGFPDDLFLHIAISFGYPIDATKLTEPPQKTGRRTLSDVAHWEKW